MEDKIHFEDPASPEKLIKKIRLHINRIKEEVEKPIVEKRFTFLEQFGFCYIIEKIPNLDPKSIKVSFPGINYNKDLFDFVFPLAYNFEENNFYRFDKSI